MQLVVHAPFGSRINRAWGLALRKRFCRKFNFELQAAATEDAIILSLSTSHSFPLEEVARYLQLEDRAPAARPGAARRADVRGALALERDRRARAACASAADARSRRSSSAWRPRTCSRRSSPTRSRAARTSSPATARFPTIRWCAQTIADCLHEAMDVDGPRAPARPDRTRRDPGRRARPHRALAARARRSCRARPYAFLDDAPLEERRTQAVMARRWLDPETAADLGKLDADAIGACATRCGPTLRNADELHDATRNARFPGRRRARAQPSGARSLDELRASAAGDARRSAPGSWVAAERLPEFDAVFPGAPRAPEIEPPADYQEGLAARRRARRDRARPPARARPGDGGCARRAARAAARRRRGRAGAARSGGLGDARPVLAGRGRDRVVRAAAARAHPSLHGAPAARGDRAGGGAGLPALPLPLAARRTRVARRRRRRARGDRLPARRLRGAGGGVGDRAPAGARQRVRPGVARRAEPRGPRRVDAPGDRCVANSERTPAPVRTTPIALLGRRNLAQWTALAPTGDAAALYRTRPGGRRLHRRARRLVLRRDRATAPGFCAPRSRKRSASSSRSGSSTATASAACARCWCRPTAAGRSAASAAPAHRAVRDRGRRTLGAGAPEASRVQSEPDDRRARRPLACSSAMASSSGAWSSARPTGCRRGAICCAACAGSRRAARSAADGSSPASRASSSRCPKRSGCCATCDARSAPARSSRLSGADPLNLVGVLTPGARLPALTGNRLLYRDGVPIALLGRWRGAVPREARAAGRVERAERAAPAAGAGGAAVPGVTASRPSPRAAGSCHFPRRRIARHLSATRLWQSRCLFSASADDSPSTRVRIACPHAAGDPCARP